MAGEPIEDFKKEPGPTTLSIAEREKIENEPVNLRDFVEDVVLPTYLRGVKDIFSKTIDALPDISVQDAWNDWGPDAAELNNLGQDIVSLESGGMKLTLVRQTRADGSFVWDYISPTFKYPLLPFQDEIQEKFFIGLKALGEQLAKTLNTKKFN